MLILFMYMRFFFGVFYQTHCLLTVLIFEPNLFYNSFVCISYYDFSVLMSLFIITILICVCSLGKKSF
uniref:Uncharacterized protein n=1 Tax=Pararge aegeria TaxID=116150 RepID=S4P7H1_9NEOP